MAVREHTSHHVLGYDSSSTIEIVLAFHHVSYEHPVVVVEHHASADIDCITDCDILVSIIHGVT